MGVGDAFNDALGRLECRAVILACKMMSFVHFSNLLQSFYSKAEDQGQALEQT
jgi:hypothetical protein